MRKLLITLATVVSLVFTGCNDIEEETAGATLSLDKENVVMTNALGGSTTATLRAIYSGDSSDLEWFSANKSIVSIEDVTGSVATIMCQGVAGSVNIGVRTSDGSLEALCSVTVSLSEAPATCVTDCVLVENSETAKGFTLTWTDASRASSTVIDIFETSEDREAGLALASASSSQSPDVYSSYSVKNGFESYKVDDLKTDADGKTYYVAVYGFLNGKRSTTAEIFEVTLEADRTAPSNILSVTSSVTDHTVTLNWTEPADDDYAGVVVTLKDPVTDFAGEEIPELSRSKTIGKGTYKVTFSSLSADTEYVFEFKTYDVNGNHQGDSNNIELGAESSATTLTDTTAPSAVSSASGSAGRKSATVAWIDPDDEDLKEIHVYQGDSDEYTTVNVSTSENKANSLQISGLSENTAYSFTVKACDYNGNESSAATVSATTANPVATNVKAVCSAIDFTDASVTATVSWTAPSAVEYSNDEVVTYAYYVSVTSGNVLVDEKSTNPGVTSVDIAGLTSGTDYTFEVTTIPSDEGSYTGTDSTLTKKIVGMIAVKNNWGGRVLVPFKTSSKSYVNCVIVQDDSSKTYNPSVMTYPNWIVRAPLNGTDGYFSLEAATADGEASGVYLYFSATAPSGSTNYDVDGTGWGSGSSPHCFYGDVAQIGTDIDKACFKFDEETGKGGDLDGCSTWMTVKTADGKYFWSGNSNPGLKDTADKASGDYNWCYKVITE